MKAHFYHPTDDSLAQRVKAFQGAYSAWLNIEASFHYYDKEGWTDRLGEKDDLEAAMKITQNTLNKAVSSFNYNELTIIADKKLLSSELLEFLNMELNSSKIDKSTIIEQRKAEINKIRSSSSSVKDDSLDLEK